jgi:hypothetical protein
MRALVLGALIELAGCVDGFQGSNIQFDFSPGTPIQATLGQAMPGPGELPINTHYTLYAVQDDVDGAGRPVARLFEVQRFEIHRIVDLASPCFIDVGAHVPHPGLHVSQYAKQIEQDTGISDPSHPPPGSTEQQQIDVATAITRQGEVGLLASDMGLKVVSGASVATYPAVATSCTDTSSIPPPTCTDPDANARRLAACQGFWRANPDYFEGTDRVLTAPLAGTTHGMVDGMNPINLAPVGGAQFFVTSQLDGFDAYAVYWQYDDANGDGMPDYPTSVPPDQRSATGTQLLFGTPTTPTRGVIHVHLTGPDLGVTAELAIFAHLDQDDSSF